MLYLSAIREILMGQDLLFRDRSQKGKNEGDVILMQRIRRRESIPMAEQRFRLYLIWMI